MGIKAERYSSKIPEEMLKVANELKFPCNKYFLLFHYPFSSVITPILTKILDSKVDNLTKTGKKLEIIYKNSSRK